MSNHAQQEVRFLLTLASQVTTVTLCVVANLVNANFVNFDLGIAVSNTPSAVDAATANTAIFLILGALRCAWVPQLSIREGTWRGDSPLGRDPDGMVLGVLGMGGIGSATARRAAGFGFDIQYHNRQQVQGLSKAFGAQAPRYVGFEELLRTSDIISIHLPLTATTSKLIGKAEIDMMKPDAIIINTARGPIIDEEALVEALESGKIWSVGLDVYENEPKVSPALLKHPRTVLLPHIGTATVDTQVSNLTT
jgi:glyoxylate reductase